MNHSKSQEATGQGMEGPGDALGTDDKKVCSLASRALR